MANSRRGAIKAQREGNVQEKDDKVVAIDFSEVDASIRQTKAKEKDEKATDHIVKEQKSDDEDTQVIEETPIIEEKKRRKKGSDDELESVINKTDELEKHTKKQRTNRNKKIAICALFSLSAGLLITFNGSEINKAAKTLATEYNLEYRFHFVGEQKAYDEINAQVEEQKALIQEQNAEYIAFIEEYKYKIDDNKVKEAGDDIKALNTYYASVIMDNYLTTVNNYIEALDEVYAEEVELSEEDKTLYDEFKAEYEELKKTEVKTATEAIELINKLSANENSITNLTHIKISEPITTIDGVILSDTSNTPEGTCPMATWSMSNESTGATEEITDIACSVELTYENLIMWIETFFGLTYVEEVPVNTYIHTEKTFAIGYLPSTDFMNTYIYTYLSEYLLPSDNAFSVTPLGDGYTVSIWDTNPNN